MLLPIPVETPVTTTDFAGICFWLLFPQRYTPYIAKQRYTAYILNIHSIHLEAGRVKTYSVLEKHNH